MVHLQDVAQIGSEGLEQLRQLPEDVVCLARHVEARVLGDDATDVKHAMMLDHFVEQTFVGQDALDHDGTDVAV